MNHRPRLFPWLRTTFAILLCTLASSAGAIGPDPYDEWRTADSEHFTAHYEQAHRAYAQKVLTLAEKIYGPVTKALDWVPYERTHIALLGNIDLANGYATPFPFNQMGIFLTPPDFTDDLVRGQWLELVLHHEFTHIVHLDKSSGAPKFLRNIFGRAPSATGILIPTLFPNVFQPRWVVEGLATYSESAPALGIGRLRGPFFEATLRDERKRGFMTLREINADGRRPPLYRNYLYGAYFFEFLTRKYGADAALKLVQSYSDDWIPFRLHSVPYDLTGKMMDELYVEFIADLTEQVDARAAALLAQPESLGAPVGKPYREVYSVAAGKGTSAGYLYAVTDDGLTEPRLQRFDAQGRPETLARSRYGTRIDVRADGSVIASQLEICDGHDLYYDLYVISPGGWLGPRRLTDCGRYFRAVWSADGQHLFALKHTDGTQSVVRLDADGRNEQVLLTGKDDVQWLDLATAPDGKRLALIGKHAASFAVHEMGIARKALSTRHADSDFKYSPHYQGDALYFLGAVDNVFNVWRLLANGQLERVTHAHTAVTLFGGAGADGQLALGVLRDGETLIHRGASASVLQTAQSQPQAPDPAAVAPSVFTAPQAPTTLQDERDYSALSTLAPRSWVPSLYADRDTFGLGLSTFGSDALGIHNYFLAPMYEFTQREPLGFVGYAYNDRPFSRSSAT
ncbi:MAG: hypothetical protein FJY37_16335 [Betaproteobacteria bacterium]|nr:hypothetical protein [Betaproteobacteria bacterium]